MSFLNKQLLTHRRQIISLAPALSSTMNTVMLSPPTTILFTSKSNYHTSTPLQRSGWKPPRNPKISITLEQLRMAARGTGRRVPICHDEQEKVMNSLEAAKYENHAIYRYIKEYDKCREEHELNNKGNDKKLMMKELNKYLTRKRKKQK